MTTPAGLDRLYELLPTIYREHDERDGYPLRVLLRVIAEQLNILERDVAQLYDDLFIETCRSWVVPYIAELVGNDVLFDSSRIARPDDVELLAYEDLTGPEFRPPIAARARADVAKTIYYRRRKGTLAMLEELARDVTGWPAHAVEFFELEGWNQHVEHLRPQSRWIDVRSPDTRALLSGPFDVASRTPDVRPIAQLEGWYGHRNIGFFLWRVQSFPLADVEARASSAAAWSLHFSPLGNPAPLFTHWRREARESELATELEVPGPVRPTFFYADLEQHRSLPAPRPSFTALYGERPDSSFLIAVNGTVVSPDDLVCRSFETWPPANQPTGAAVAVDVARGRIVLGDGWGPAPEVRASYHYGSPSQIGGGPYPRREWLVRDDLAELRRRVQAAGGTGLSGDPVTDQTLTSALQAWETQGKPNTIITVLDSRTYSLPASIELRNDKWLVIQAANGQRPLVQTAASGFELRVNVPASTTDRRSSLTLSGLVLEGWIRVTGDLGILRLLHATVVPGRSLTEDGRPATGDASLEVSGAGPINSQLRVLIAYSITGPLVIPENAAQVLLVDSIVDGLGGFALSGSGVTPILPGPPTDVRRTTMLGRTRVRQLDASESVFTRLIEVDRTQAGCLRFSFVPPGSRTARRFQCQPELAIQRAIENAKLQASPAQVDQVAIRNAIEGWLRPSFTSTRYGDPGYAQLHLACPVDITRGAEDGAEMGAFAHLKMPQRESNLRLRLREYLPFGLDAGVIYVT